MKVKVGLVEIEGPDTLSADGFGKLVDAIGIRLDRLADIAIQLIPATATIAATVATTAPGTEPSPVA